MRKADRAKRLCGEIPGGDIKTPSGKTAIFRKGGNAFEDIRTKLQRKNILSEMPRSAAQV